VLDDDLDQSLVGLIVALVGVGLIALAAAGLAGLTLLHHMLRGAVLSSHLHRRICKSFEQYPQLYRRVFAQERS